MIDKIHSLLAYLRYQKNAQTKYYIHSPFVYQFYLNVLEGKNRFKNIENIRKVLEKNRLKIEVNDFGANKGTYLKSISSIAKHVAVPEKYGQFLNSLATYLEANTILELGTSLGLGSAYLAANHSNAQIISIEGSATVAAIAKANLTSLNIQNVEIICGNFDDVLPSVLKRNVKLDLIYIDGNHRYEPTINYFNLLKNKLSTKGCIVFDDIYWSKEMIKAWEEIKEDKEVKLTLDIYRMGIVFFGKDKLAKEDFVLRY